MTTANRWVIETVALDQMKVSGANARKITNKNFHGLSSSLKRFGMVEPIVWNKRTGNIVGGHQRYRALMDAGVKETITLVVDLSPEDEQAANVTLNNPSIQGEFDDSALHLLSELKKQDEEMFKQLNMTQLTDSLEKQFNVGGTFTPDAGDGDGPELKTKCPCCGHQWEVQPKDISVEET